MKIINMDFEVDGVEYKWRSDWDGKGGDLYNKDGDTLATLELVTATKSVGSKKKAPRFWVVYNWDGAKKVPGKAEYAHPQLGDLLHSSNIRVGNARAMAARTLKLFKEHGWTGNRRRKS